MPTLRFVLIAADDGVDFTQANLDLAIVFGGEPEEEGIHGRTLAAETLVAVGAPGTPADAALISHPGDIRPGGLTVGDAGLALDAAALGFGIARVPATLAAADLAAGRVVAIGDAEPTSDAYWLLAPTPQWRQAKVRALVEFLLAGGQPAG